jgi:L-fuconolactonase
MRVLDSHLHVWDLSVSDYGWLGPRHGPLHRSFAPDEAAQELAQAGVSAAILVQADDSEADTRYLLEAATRHDWVYGVVGWLPLDEPEKVASALDAGDQPDLVGVRHLVHDDPRDDFLDLDSVRRSLAMVAGHGLTFDVPDSWPRHLDAAVRLADALPDLVVVIDHLAKPPRGRDDLADWEKALREAAARPNVRAKVSGLQLDGQPYTATALRSVLVVALEAFGPSRLMFGSDWPMTLAHGGYAASLAVTRELLAELSPAEQQLVWHDVAETTYPRGAHG